MAGHFTDDYLLYLLAQASAAASHQFHAELAARNIAVSTWRILASLYPDRALSIGELASECIFVQPTLTRMVDRLEASGEVMRSSGGDDRRRVQVRLTASGQALAAQLVAEAKAHERRICGSYSSREIEILKDTLKNLRQRARDIHQGEH
mgnify:CR=1 FL=1